MQAIWRSGSGGYAARSGTSRCAQPVGLVALLLLAGASCALAVPAPRLEVELVGQPVVDAANHYSEDARVRIRLAYPPGQPPAGAPERAAYVEELGATTMRVYDGRQGASLLPATLQLHQSQAELTLRSLAAYPVNDMHYAGAEIAVTVDGQRRLLNVPQWVDADGDGKTDWLEQRVENLLRRMRRSGAPEVVRVIGALHGWKEWYQRDCGSFDETEPGYAQIAAACLDWDGRNSHRLNLHQELAATLLHEARHVWVHQNPELDPFKHSLLRLRRGGTPASLCLQAQAGSPFCGGQGWLQDRRYAAQEDDAEAFAEKYKRLFP